MKNERTKTCCYCDKEYILNSKYSNKQILDSKFCSRDCQYKGKNTFIRQKLKEIEMTCSVCSHIFKSYKSQRKYKSIHCSVRCAGITNGIRKKGTKSKKESIEKFIETRKINGSFKQTEEQKRKSSETKRKANRCGAQIWNWKGGENRQKDRKIAAYQDWRKLVLVRDNFTCVHCGIKFIKGITGRVYLEVDHIKPYSLYPELRLNVDNGRTLCEPCHKKTDTWGGKTMRKYETKN